MVFSVPTAALRAGGMERLIEDFAEKFGKIAGNVERFALYDLSNRYRCGKCSIVRVTRRWNRFLVNEEQIVNQIYRDNILFHGLSTRFRWKERTTLFSVA